jgi:hypothetical protein
MAARGRGKVEVAKEVKVGLVGYSPFYPFILLWGGGVL